MNIYLISQHVTQHYDRYDSGVVVAESAYDAREIYPDPDYRHDHVDEGWVAPAQRHRINVRLLGKADGSLKRGAVLGSYNAS